MPTLNAAQTVNLAFTVPGALLVVDCSGGAVVDVSWTSAGSISGRRTVQNISEDIGPFGDQTAVTMYCRSGVASYSSSGDQASIAAVQALVNGGGVLARGSIPRTTPTFGGTGGDMSFGGKKRWMDWAGVPGQYVFRGGAMHMGDLQFGTRSTDTPANFSTSAYVTDIETGGAQPALYTPVTTAGTMSIAGGRFRQRADGSVRIMHYADDALYSSAPRFQFTSFLMPNRVPLRTTLVVQFGDDETPWPPYVSGKQNSLFWQVKGATGQPPLALNMERQADGSLKLYFNRKLSNTTGIWTAGTVSGLAVNTPISIQIDYTLDWLTADEGGKAYIAVTVNGVLMQLTDSAGFAEGTASVDMPTIFTDVDQAYNLINGIYRFDYAGSKAPNDAAMIYWQHETRLRGY